MQLPPVRARRRSSRGQAMAEFAIILPILLLLLVMTIDFGRVYFGWVALQNAARIAADQAARTPDAWPATSSEDDKHQATYQELVTADLEAINCSYDDPVPDPTFVDVNGDGDDRAYGDHAVVQLTCEFGLLTPLAQSVIGGPVTMAAEATFPINGMVVMGLPEGQVPPPDPECQADEAEVPDLVNQTMQNAHSAWTTAGFDSANFSPPLVLTGPGNNKNKIVLTQSLTAGNCEKLDASITVTHS